MNIEVRPVTPLPTEVTSGCGVSATQMCLESFGIHIGQKELAKELGTTQEDGTSIEQIRNFFWRMGFTTTEKAWCTWETLKQIRLSNNNPIILEWWDDRDYKELGIDTPNTEPDSHYSVLQRMNDTEITIADPSFGDEVTFGREYWMNHWRYRNDYVGTYSWFMMVGR